MASTYSPSLRIELIGAGEQAGTWNTTTNTNLGTLIESAIAGYVSVSVTSANQALTALDGAPDQARNAVIALTTTTTAAFAVYAPPQEKQYIVWNNTAYTATVYNSTSLGNTTAAGTGVVIPAFKKLVVFSDGVNFYTVEAANLTGVLPVVNGGTGVTTSTGTGSVVLSTSPTLVTPALGTPSALVGTNITGTAAGLSIGGSAATAASCSGNAATATNPQSGGTFITSSNIGSQSVNFASSATSATTAASCSGNAATATNPQAGGTFITSSNIGSQSVSFATSATNATNSTNATNATTAASCSGNAATATNPQAGGSFIT